MTSEEDSIRRSSRRLSKTFGWIFGFGVVLLISEVLYIPTKRLGFALGSDRTGTAIVEWLDTLLLGLPAIALLLALWFARRMMRDVAEHGPFGPMSGRDLGRVGTSLLVSAVAMILFTDTETLRPAAPGNLPLIATAAALGCVGLALRLLGRFQTHAAALKAENSEFV